MRLSKHFTLEEMTRSMVAARRGIDNTPGAGDIKNLENLCYIVLEPGWIHVSYNEKGENRKQVLTFDGKKYTNGFPDMKWKDGKVTE